VKYRNKQSHISELLGNRGLSAVVDFPNRLDYFVSILPLGNFYSVERIINENTLLPFYEPFLPSDRAELVRQEMKDDSKDNHLRSRAATTVKQVKMPEHLRFCPLCVEDDKNEYGETYWHRLHQLPGVLVCPKHSCFLEDSSLEWKRGIGSHFYSAEDYISRKKPRLLKQSNANQQVLIKLAENAEWLLCQNYISIGNDVIRDRYYNQLLKKELAYYNGRIRNNKLFKAFQDFYSPALLATIGCQIESTHRSWIFRIVEKSKTDMIHHPIRHFLMMSFLGFTAEEFFTSFVEFKPFIDGPYPCLSRACNHYGEFRIQQCEVFDNLTKGERRGKPIAIFTCECGFIYQRVGPDKSEEDRFRYDSVREYGAVWENKLRELWDDLSLSRAEIARRLKISDLSVTNIAHRLNFPMNKPGTRVSNDKAHRKTPRRTLSESKKLYRKKWLKVLKENPQANRDKLIKLANFEYLWLMRNDAEWTKKHLPEVLKIQRKKEHLDWQKIDDKLSMAVLRACSDIITALPPKRVCITEIIKITGYKKWIEKRELKLPKTTQILKEKLESLEDYMIRKLKLAERKFIEERKIPIHYQLVRGAVINNHTTKNSERIQREITITLAEIKRQLT
ncbi:MAG TPA: TnsD family Tn7-like transposition protein, partial [Pyrinomonadaceae bacterium]